jgi:hypothetical protein
MNECRGLYVPNPNAESFAAVFAGSLIENQRAVFKKYPSP